MQPSYAGSRMAPFLNTNRPSAEPGSIPTSKRLQSVGMLVATGHTITYRNVYRQLIRYLPESRKKSSSDSQLPRATVFARDAVFLLLRRPQELETEDRETLALLRSLHVEVEQAYELVQQFTQMHHTRAGEQLDTWLEKVRVSQISELQGFVSGIERDKKAVKAGLTLPQSN